jgi:hypothetical protein
MLYFKKNKLAFFHIAKTGGTSFRDFLMRRLGGKTWYIKDTNHEPLTSKIDVMGQNLFNKIHIVTLIRNPFDVVVSYYDSIYSPSCSKNGKLKPLVAKKYPFLLDVYGRPFGEFVDWYIENEKSYADYLLVGGKIPNNVYIIKLENLKEDAHRVLNTKLKLNLNVNQIPRLNTSKRKKPIMGYYNKGSLNKIVMKYKWTFDNEFYKLRGDKDGR